ncbi:hypothetical protein MKW92_029922 [Papaver armeniacum]|nr:hypothetical protein MKW92_029922 [Papaver armeniacum]
MLVPAPIFYFKTFWLFAVVFTHQAMLKMCRREYIFSNSLFQTQLCCSFTRRFGCRSCGS